MNQDEPMQFQIYVIENELSTKVSSIDNNGASLKSMDDTGTDGTNRWDNTSTVGKGKSGVIAAEKRFLESENTSKQDLDIKRGEKMSNNSSFDLLFKELKDDMREREQRSEKRFEVQQELLLNSIDNKLNERFDKTESEIRRVNDEIKDIRYEIKDVKNNTIRWGIGIVASIIIAFIGALPQLIDVIFKISQN
ncbi:MAG: hypothetical protein ABS939_20870 [Psychrobacillus sp.]